MTWQEAGQVALIVVAGLGGGGAIVFALADWLGRLWADRLAERQRLQSERELTSQRGRIDDALARVEAALEHRNLLLQRLADIELEGLRECWVRARRCQIQMNGLRPIDSGTDEEDFRKRLVGLGSAHNTYLAKMAEFEPFLEESFGPPLENIRRTVSLEISQARRATFTSEWWDQGEKNRSDCDVHMASLRTLLRRRVSDLRRLAQSEIM